MNCKQPVVMSEREAFPCGQCLPCRINRRRVWAHRIMLEAAQYSDNAFVTLTYSDEGYAKSCKDRGVDVPEKWPLVKSDLQLWLKRFRKAIEPDKVRFFAVGEYGDETFRPHYHLALFGYGTCQYGASTYNARRRKCCPRCDMVRDTWGLGNISLGTLEAASASYIARYVAKKFSHKKAIGELPPEFARMSLRPGIGGDAIHEIASQLLHFALDEKLLDVPNALRHGRKLLPLGRYLRKRLRLAIGRDGKVPQAAYDEWLETLQPMLSAAVSHAHLLVPAESSHPKKWEARRSIIGEQLDQAVAGKVASIEAKEKIFARKGNV